MKRKVNQEVLWSATIAVVLASLFMFVNWTPIPVVGQVAVYLAIAASGNPHSPSGILIWFFLALMLWVPVCLVAVVLSAVRLAIKGQRA